MLLSMLRNTQNGVCWMFTYNDGPKEEGEPLVEFQLVEKQQKSSDQKLQHCGCKVCWSGGSSEAHKRNKQGHLICKGRFSINYLRCTDGLPVILYVTRWTFWWVFDIKCTLWCHFCFSFWKTLHGVSCFQQSVNLWKQTALPAVSLPRSWLHARRLKLLRPTENILCS